MKTKVIIFDFDGTIADSFWIALQVYRKLAKRVGRPTDDQEVERLRSMPARQVLKDTGVSWWSLPIIMYEARKAIRQGLPHLKPIAGTPPVLQKLHDQGFRMFIVSTNTNKNIIQFLRRNKLESYFERIYGGSGLFDKSGVLQKIVRQNDISLKDCYYVGDEVRDLEAARKAHMACVSVSWGYNNVQALRAAKAKTLVDKPADLLRVFAVE